jgi:hypothetical protein
MGCKLWVGTSDFCAADRADGDAECPVGRGDPENLPPATVEDAQVAIEALWRKYYENDEMADEEIKLLQRQFAAPGGPSAFPEPACHNCGCPEDSCMCPLPFVPGPFDAASPAAAPPTLEAIVKATFEEAADDLTRSGVVVPYWLAIAVAEPIAWVEGVRARLALPAEEDR